MNFLTRGTEMPACMVVRIVTWGMLYVGMIRGGIVRQFSYAQFLSFHVAITYALWPFMIFTYKLLLPNHYATLVTVAVEVADLRNALMANDLTFAFVSVSIGVYGISRLCFGAAPAIKLEDLATIDRYHDTWSGRRGAFLLIGFGLLASQASILLPKVFQQVLFVCSYARFYGIYILLFSYLAARPGSRSASLRLFWFLGGLLIVASWGFLLGGGQKGALIVELYVIVLFVMSIDLKRGLKFAACCLIAIVPLIFLLPKLNAFKVIEAQTQERGMTAKAKTLRNVMRGQVDASTLGDSSGALDYFIIYVPIRVTLTNMTTSYVSAYWGAPLGWRATFGLLGSALVPRVFAPSKIDLDSYYNELARVSGIGGFYDEETSRKPSLVEESIIIDNLRGIVCIGFVFGIILYIAETVVYKVVKNKEIALGVLFSTIGISQLPYIGVIPSSFIFLLGANLVFARLIMPRTMTL